jgi:hypothetical protein
MKIRDLSEVRGPGRGNGKATKRKEQNEGSGLGEGQVTFFPTRLLSVLLGSWYRARSRCGKTCSLRHCVKVSSSSHFSAPDASSLRRLNRGVVGLEPADPGRSELGNAVSKGLSNGRRRAVVVVGEAAVVVELMEGSEGAGEQPAHGSK